MKKQSRVQCLAPRVHSPDSSLSDPKLQTLDPRHPPRRWYCLSVAVPHEVAEAVANFLMELGSTGVVEGVRDFSRPQAPTTAVQGFFPAEASGPAIRGALAQYLSELSVLFPGLGSPIPRLTKVTGDAWHERWREHFPPIQVGTRFLLLPPWEPFPTSTERIVIIIDPSMAFGTGHHATTQGCLEAIESLCLTHRAPARALDLGTGSGILAIALAKLGTQAVWATDLDLVALDEARKNVAQNRVTPFIHLSDTPLEHLPGPFPLIVANLFAMTLVALAPALGEAVDPEGYAVLSGIQVDQEADVRMAYPSPVWRLSTRLARDEWVTLVLRRT
jgi:ribosomal protein L11 methyltransferase